MLSLNIFLSEKRFCFFLAQNMKAAPSTEELLWKIIAADDDVATKWNLLLNGETEGRKF